MSQVSLTKYLFFGEKQRRKKTKRVRKAKPKPKAKPKRQRQTWQIPKEEWKIMKGYEPFWMFRDYSPSQWAGMSKRTRSQIRRQQQEEARKNEAILQEHEQAVVKAYFKGLPVPKHILRGYEHIIEAKKQKRATRIETERKEMERYLKSLEMTKMEFGKWWQRQRLREAPHLKGFEHVMRQEAYRHWKAAHGITKGVPRYIIEHVGIMERRAKRR